MASIVTLIIYHKLQKLHKIKVLQCFFFIIFLLLLLFFRKPTVSIFTNKVHLFLSFAYNSVAYVLYRVHKRVPGLWMATISYVKMWQWQLSVLNIIMYPCIYIHAHTYFKLIKKSFCFCAPLFRSIFHISTFKSVRFAVILFLMVT